MRRFHSKRRLARRRRADIQLGLRKRPQLIGNATAWAKQPCYACPYSIGKHGKYHSVASRLPTRRARTLQRTVRLPCVAPGGHWRLAAFFRDLLARRASPARFRSLSPYRPIGVEFHRNWLGSIGSSSTETSFPAVLAAIASRATPTHRMRDQNTTTQVRHLPAGGSLVPVAPWRRYGPRTRRSLRPRAHRGSAARARGPCWNKRKIHPSSHPPPGDRQVLAGFWTIANKPPQRHALEAYQKWRRQECRRLGPPSPG